MKPHPKSQSLRQPIRPDRVRNIRDEGFGFLPHRFLRDGFLSSLLPDELALYVFLVLVANRTGVSFYGYDHICALLQFSLERFIDARNSLIDRDLIAFDGTRFQLLSLPETPAPLFNAPPLATGADLEEHDPATIRSIIETSLARRRRDPD